MAVAVSAALLLGAAESASAGTLDQSQTSSTGASLEFSGQQLAAQTITVGLSGNLDQVDLYVSRRPNSGGGINCDPGSGVILTVRTISAGVPTNTILASAIVPPGSVPTDPTFAFLSFTVVPPTAVAAGSQLAIVAAAPDASCTSPYHAYEWGSASGDPYGAGASFAKPSGMGWTQQGTYDFTFRTFVATPQGSIPQGTPTGQRAAALASCKKRAQKHHWSHKRLKKCKRKANLLPI